MHGPTHRWSGRIAAALLAVALSFSSRVLAGDTPGAVPGAGAPVNPGAGSSWAVAPADSGAAANPGAGVNPGVPIPTNVADKPAKSDAKPTTLAAVLIALREEATTAWLAHKPWPRDKSSYAQDKNLTLPNDDLVRALGMRFSDTAAIDGYIRWQLLSFYPNLSKLDLKGLRQMVALLPVIAAQPEPEVPGGQDASSGASRGGGGLGVAVRQTAIVNWEPVPGTNRLRPVLGVVNSGTGLQATGTVSADGRYVTLSVEEAQTNLLRLRAVAAAANLTPLAFRDALMDFIPKEGGMRVYARIEDLKRRIVAGDPSFAVAAERLFADTSARDITVSADLQKPILGGLRELAQLHNSVIKGFETDDKGRTLVRGQEISLPVKPLAQAAADLKLENAFPFPGP
jgi:hypothetical protein